MVDEKQDLGENSEQAPKELTGEEALQKLRQRSEGVVRAEPTDILRPGTLIHFLKRKDIPQVLVQGLLSEKTAKERGIKRARSGQGGSWDYVYLAQLTQEALEGKIPLAFVDDFNIEDYARGALGEDGLLSKAGILVDRRTPGIKSIYELQNVPGDPENADQLFVPEVPTEMMVGFVLSDSNFFPRKAFKEKQIRQARQQTLEWFKENILPYHEVPVYSQATGKLLFNPSKK